MTRYEYVKTVLEPRFKDENELYHHGILGMKWGVRRYQNEDGSLTPEGQRRYYQNDKGKFVKRTKNELIEYDRQAEKEKEKQEEQEKRMQNRQYIDAICNGTYKATDVDDLKGAFQNKLAFDEKFCNEYYKGLECWKQMHKIHSEDETDMLFKNDAKWKKAFSDKEIIANKLTDELYKMKPDFWSQDPKSVFYKEETPRWIVFDIVDDSLYTASEHINLDGDPIENYAFDGKYRQQQRETRPH